MPLRRVLAVVSLLAVGAGTVIGVHALIRGIDSAKQRHFAAAAQEVAGRIDRFHGSRGQYPVACDAGGLVEALELTGPLAEVVEQDFMYCSNGQSYLLVDVPLGEGSFSGSMNAPMIIHNGRFLAWPSGANVQGVSGGHGASAPEGQRP